ncbi:P-loop containing nucleoside triphosphate hydrolase protein [Leucosporidium creatinivorum]|uniref:p-loop containing nucleoside triphosphate hydrolase protein n=1 Tax=Leucosporidium creatinivorum TaxID=106004 RepID=A0A1Y2DIF4_9BASI|nr:P-loop containing nucleoside triphosphate hydrolase protein [Leucosporidium creatinivorum]
MSDLALEVNALHFAYTPVNAPKGPPVLEDVTLNLPKGSRCILVGANGAGKSTLLQILAGKKLTRSGAKVLGQDVFFSTPQGVTYLGTEWAANPVVRSDLVVSHFLDSVGGYRHQERRDRLLDILDVDLNWHMHEVSDGERRRVQIVSGLMAPWEVLLLDEVTVDLDVLVRSRLLAFLTEETQTRNATILYATHIFDGLDSFPTHLCHIQLGTTLPPSPLSWPVVFPSSDPSATVEGVPAGVREKMEDPERPGSKLLELALAWLAQDKERRIEKEIAVGGTKKRGAAKKAEGETTDSEAFYKKYDYNN